MMSAGKKTLILASESPRRRELLRNLGAEFSCISAGVEEYSEDSVPERLPEKNALLKAEAVAEKFPDSFVLGADTGVFYGGRMFGKPADTAQAEKMLSILSGKTHQVITGVALICRSRKILHCWSTVSDVAFGVLSAEDIRN